MARLSHTPSRCSGLHLTRSALTLVELLVVLAILAGMIALLMPAVQSAREASRNMVCQNNLHQLRLALQNHMELSGRVPEPNRWTVTLLPWLEERPLAEAIERGDLAAAAGNRPVVFACPSQPDPRVGEPPTRTCHYLLIVRDVGRKKREVVGMRDRNRGFEQEPIPLEPWFIGPELPWQRGSQPQDKGPHAGGKYNG